MPRSVGALNSGGRSVGALESNTIALTSSFSDSFSFSDSLEIGLGAIISDTISFSDAFTTPGQPLQAVDQFVLSDAFQGVISIPAVFNDAFNFIDSPIYSLDLEYNFNDSFTFSDNFAAAVGLTIAFSDSLSLTDNFAATLVLVITQLLSDSLSFSDNYAANLVGKLLTTIPVNLAGQPETLTLTDSIKYLLTIVANFSDTLTLTDQFGTDVPLSLSESDTFNFSDSVNSGTGAILNESLSLSDSVIQEASAPFLALTLAVSDQLVLGDIPSTQFIEENIGMLITEVIPFGDAFNSSSGVSDTSYLRRYLNDVLIGED